MNISEIYVEKIHYKTGLPKTSILEAIKECKTMLDVSQLCLGTQIHRRIIFDELIDYRVQSKLARSR